MNKQEGLHKQLIAILACVLILTFTFVSSQKNRIIGKSAASCDTGIPFVPVVIAAGDRHSLAIDENGYLWAWGGNSDGQLGDGTTTNRLCPTRHNGDHAKRKYKAITVGGFYSLALDVDGYLWSWGENNDGNLGDGTREKRYTPTRHNHHSECYNDYCHADCHYSRKYVSIAACGGWGQDISLAIDADGFLWAWGNNAYGSIGDGTGIGKYEPVRQTGEHHGRKYTDISVGECCVHALALDQDGHIWGWGANWNGQLGDGTEEEKYEPATHTGDHANRKYKAIAAGKHYSLAIDAEGHMWAWGSNAYGAFGDGTADDSYQPTRHTLDHHDRKYTTVTVGGDSSRAIDNDGYIWSWGDNWHGKIGDGTTDERHEPTRHNNAHSTRKYAAVASGANHALAIDETGCLWAWGFNAYGQLGDGTTIDSFEPVQISYKPSRLDITGAAINEAPQNRLVLSGIEDPEGILTYRWSYRKNKTTLTSITTIPTQDWVEFVRDATRNITYQCEILIDDDVVGTLTYIIRPSSAQTLFEKYAASILVVLCLVLVITVSIIISIQRGKKRNKKILTKDGKKSI